MKSLLASPFLRPALAPKKGNLAHTTTWFVCLTSIHFGDFLAHEAQIMNNEQQALRSSTQYTFTE